MPEEISPEEKLLRLIRRKPSPLKGEVSAIASGSPGLALGEHSLKIIKSLDKIFIAGIVLLMVYFGQQLLFGKKYEVLIEPEESEQENISPTPAVNAQIVAQPFSYYEAKISQRDIFEQNDPSKPVTPTPVVETPPVTNIPELTKRLKLVGIVLGEESEAIVEDLDEKSTHFLKVGDKLKEATLEDIQEGKVIFLFNNQHIELVQ